ncbi:vomeronasal 1 receptor oryCunV1R1669 [Oryctolagus cuniculus]|uniref:Vomeronasal type-1 receptor n=1 Tax=Oryctolagus cuniculus TaxID=9986 RepID=A0A5F9C1X9_RABIT|nr:vomeronasal 1 receptor oryCunV1R1669 [Oryctolagus cuniculus]XP_051693297.1 vomeronasal 1 receptor oryCunV1R1669 isoform X1 [Oryctolagus cuniculus]
MFPGDTILSFFLIAQISIGVMANSFLFIIYIYAFLIKPQLKKPIDSIFMHLTVVNIITIVFQSIPDIVSSFGVKRFLDNVGCQSFFYIYRVTRGLSICTTSLLSVFQAITISPSHSKWARLKSKLSTWIFPSFLIFWIINMLIYIHIIETLRAKWNFTVIGHGFVHAYCQTRQSGDRHSGSFVSVMLTRDFLFMAPMIVSSLYMVGLLYRHHRRARHIHSSSLSRQTSPENRATHTILLLAFCFVFFYCCNNFVYIYAFYRPEKDSRLEDINGILSSCYPTFCPFLLMKNTKNIPKLTSCL